MREAVVLFAGLFALGLIQAAPSVVTGDSGEFAAAAATLAIPHAPGFPLFVLLGKVFGSAFALGGWAYRMNLLCAVCGAAAAALFCDALRRFGAGRAARLGAALLLGLGPLWREQSAVAEVFAPLVLAACALLWIAASAGPRLLDPGPAAALGLVFGLGLGLHQTLLFVLPALLLFGREQPKRLPAAVAWAAAGALAGFSVHLILPLRALKSPPLDWGHATTFAAFKRLLLREDYGTFSLTVDGPSGVEGAAAQLARFGRGVLSQLGVPGAALAVLGLCAGRRTPLRGLLAPAAAWLLFAGPGFLLVGRPGFDAQTNGALERFLLLPLLGAGLLAALGLEFLAARAPAGAWAAALAGAAFLLPGAAAASRRGDFLAEDYGRAVLRSVPPGGVLVMDGGDDTFYATAYLSHARGLRRDVELRDRGGVVFPGGYGPNFRSLTKEAKEARRVEVEARWDAEGRLRYSTLSDSFLPGRVLVPSGLLRIPAAPGARVPEAEALRATTAWRWTRESVARRYRDRALAGLGPYQKGADALSRGRAAEGAAWLELAAATAPDALWTAPSVSYALGVAGYRFMASRDWSAAEAAYRAWAGVAPARAEPWSNLGVALERAGRFEESEAAYREGIRVEPSSPLPWRSLGALLWTRGRWGESADAFASAAALPGALPSDAAYSERARARARR